MKTTYTAYKDKLKYKRNMHKDYHRKGLYNLLNRTMLINVLKSKVSSFPTSHTDINESISELHAELISSQLICRQLISEELDTRQLTGA